jgi:hypothetical protein
MDGSSTKDKIVKSLLSVWYGGNRDGRQAVTKWTKTIWKVPGIMQGKHELKLGEEHVKITKVDGVIGTMLKKEILQQTETFVIKTRDVKWIHLSSASRIPLSRWFLTTAVIANPWILPGAIADHLDTLLQLVSSRARPFLAK